MRLKNKVAIVTGGGSGMGRAASILFAQEGAKVVICGRREHEGSIVVDEILKEGGEAIFVKTDVSIESDVKRLIEKSILKFEKIDILFNNAGINSRDAGEVHNENIETLNNIMDINIKGSFFCIKYVVPHMIKNAGGSIINNSSVLDSQAMKGGSTAYHISKGGVSMLTKKSAVDYADFNIRVNSIQPGAIATEISGIPWDDLSNKGIIEKREKLQPLKRMGHPFDIAYAALYFASDESAFVTGSTLLVDGGASASFAKWNV